MKFTPTKKILMVTLGLIVLSGCNKAKEEEVISPLPVISFVNKAPEVPKVKEGVDIQPSRLTGLKLADMPNSHSSVEKHNGLVLSKSINEPSPIVETSRNNIQPAPFNQSVTIAYDRGDAGIALLNLIVEAYRLDLSASSAVRSKLSLIESPNSGQMTFDSLDQALDQLVTPMGVKWMLNGHRLTISD